MKLNEVLIFVGVPARRRSKGGLVILVWRLPGGLLALTTLVFLGACTAPSARSCWPHAVSRGSAAACSSLGDSALPFGTPRLGRSAPRALRTSGAPHLGRSAPRALRTSVGRSAPRALLPSQLLACDAPRLGAFFSFGARSARRFACVPQFNAVLLATLLHRRALLSRTTASSSQARRHFHHHERGERRERQSGELRAHRDRHGSHECASR